MFCQLVQIWYKITPHTAYIRKLVTFKSQVTATSLENLVDENTVTTIPKLLSGVFKMSKFTGKIPQVSLRRPSKGFK